MNNQKIFPINSALMNEFYVVQQSMKARYDELLGDQIYAPIKQAKLKASKWITKRAKMLMKLEGKIQYKMNRLTKNLLKF